MFLLIRKADVLCECNVHFNTSHVSINRGQNRPEADYTGISIHLMFLLIKDVLHPLGIKKHFNTSHVSINRWDGLRHRLIC